MINLWPFKQSANFTLENSLFGAVKVTKNADFDKYKYSGYDIGLMQFEVFCYLIVAVW